MRLIIDGQVHYAQAESEELRQELALLRTDERYVQSVSCEGLEVNLSDLLTGELRPSPGTPVEIVTCSLDQLLENTMDSVHEYLPRLYSAWKQTVDWWRTGEREAGAKRFAETVRGLQWNLSVLANLSALGPADSDVADINTVGQGVVRPLLAAWENEDFVQLADILEYEAMPWLERWFAFVVLFRRQMRLEQVKSTLN
ncbi:Hypothetical protein DEACI_4003 [Acididesulfobacillus acetoxydans]|uniref:Uncharacterized protein n=1 Tax=Acididesulfobacillus acetoxydans TaxID=1561005 RepID=A0A8S0X7B5_9FIRM|nr:hypothetical protein [Acididesulfobacillus acetoxydans]CAA7603180.1 Hypothetical protein DEACI_4003 [Acididesulfobacillus acetoxydans]CEJ07592.1 Hypothetical protein DEACI_2058 [Acididesulfobacillus acetoxydans]